jgi:hypothetical protein
LAAHLAKLLEAQKVATRVEKKVVMMVDLTVSKLVELRVAWKGY